jgi:hypothetical protein
VSRAANDLAVERVAMVAGQGLAQWGVRNRQRAELLLTELLTTAAQLGVDPEWLVWNSELARICLSATKRFPLNVPVDESVGRAEVLDERPATVSPSARFDR